MPDKLIPILDSIFMSIITLYVFVASFSFISIIASVLAVIFWAGKIKRDITQYHKGEVSSWLKWFVKKN